MSFLNYEPDILERIDTLAKSQDQRRKIYDEINQILYDRAKLEEFYSRSLERLCDGLSKIKIKNNDCLKSIIQVIITLFSSQAEQSQTFGSSINSDIIPQMKDLFKDDSHLLKNMQKIGDRHEKELMKQIEGFDKIRKQYVQMSQVVEKKIREQKKAREQYEIEAKQNERRQEIQIINMLKKRKQDIENEDKLVECMERQKQKSENDLQQYINKYNQYIDTYFLDIATIEDQITNLEISNRNILKDSIFKYLVFKVSLVRNVQYDVDRITSKLEEIDTKQNIQSYLSEMLHSSREQKNNIVKPLLCKLNFDNYKQFIDTKMISNNNAHQNNSSIQQQKIKQQQHLQLQQHNNLNQQQSQLQQQQQKPKDMQNPIHVNNQAAGQNGTQEGKPRPKIFSQQSGPQINPINQNNLHKGQTQPEQNLVQKKPHMKIFSEIGQRKTSNDLANQRNSQPFNVSNIQQKKQDIPQQQDQVSQQSEIQQQQPQQQQSEVQLNNQIQIQEDQNQNNQRVVLIKTDSNNIKQPKDYKYIDIMTLIQEKQQATKIKNLAEQKKNQTQENIQEVQNEEQEEEKIVEIEREDLFEYILLKIWHNNELQSYDVDQLKSIIERDNESRKAFSNYYCNFFNQMIQQHAQLLEDQENDMVNKLLLRTGKTEIQIEISSDAYTYLMRILYTVLDVLNSSNDLHFISDIFRTSKSIFKVIRPPDEDIKSFERIFLHQGLSGHTLFTSQTHQQNKLKSIIELIENEYEQRVRNLSSVSDNEEIQNKKDNEIIIKINDNDLIYLHGESSYLYTRLLESIRDLFEFDIQKDKIIQIIKNLVEDAVLTLDISKCLINYVEGYEKKEIAIMQSDNNIGLENNNQIQLVKNNSVNEIKDFVPSNQSSDDNDDVYDDDQNEKQYQNVLDPTNCESFDNDQVDMNLNNIKQINDQNNNQFQDTDEYSEDIDNDNIEDLQNKYEEGLS